MEEYGDSDGRWLQLCQGHVKCPLPEAGQEWTMMDNEKLTKLRA